jgi:DNA-binding response OmpR family regulator
MSNRVLIVDNDPHVVRLLQWMVRPLDVEVVCCEYLSDVRAACESAVLVLCVLHPRNMTAREVVRVLREGGSAAPVLLLSGEGAQASEEACAAAGADGFLCKPFTRQPLLERISQLIGDSQLTRTT